MLSTVCPGLALLWAWAWCSLCVWWAQGYKSIMESCAAQAAYLREAIVATGDFTILSKDIGVPLVAFSLKDRSGFDEYDIADALRNYGWIVPAYTMAPNAQVWPSKRHKPG